MTLHTPIVCEYISGENVRCWQDWLLSILHEFLLFRGTEEPKKQPSPAGVKIFSHGFPMVFPWFSHGFPIAVPTQQPSWDPLGIGPGLVLPRDSTAADRQSIWTPASHPCSPFEHQQRP